METTEKNSFFTKKIHYIFLLIFSLLILTISAYFLVKNLQVNEVGKLVWSTESNTEEESVSPEEQEYLHLLEEVDRMALSYDYDAAIEKIKSYMGYENNPELTDRISKFTSEKEACVPVNMDEVTHIFYHTLTVDPVRCFGNERDPQCTGNNQWMTTVSEFNKITQEMYERGYVLVSIHDLYNISVDENGRTVMEPAVLMLPEGKKAFVMSLDDLSYYHSYDDYGFAAKLILDENGKVVNEYIDAEGNTLVGAYDVVPLLDQFIEEHPDASYRGAKGTIALTGYNGILGYRTDISYENQIGINWDKKQWLKEHPDFNLEQERTNAKIVADAMKENGWTFASHTWGHKNVGTSSLSVLQGDNRRWKENVEPIIGETNVIVFAHGTDLEDWGDYSPSNEKFQYYYSEGFNVFMNVDSHKYATWFGDGYLRQGRRNLDGYRIYYNAIGEQNNLSDLFDAKEILDPKRPPVPEL